MTYRQFLIKRLAAARRDYKRAQQNDRRERKIHACPDDETIYQVYITQERLSCWEAALEVHRAKVAETQKR